MIYRDETIVDFVTRNCGIDFAGIVGIGLINIYEDPDESDLSDPDFWNTADETKYIVIRNTRGEYVDPEVSQEEDLVGFVNTGANHTAMIEVDNVKDNRDFWAWVQKHNWKICLITGGGLLLYVNRPVSIYPKIVNGRSIKGSAYFNVQMKWQGLSNPIIVEEPDGIFTGDYNPMVVEMTFDLTSRYPFDSDILYSFDEM